jgi:hypothetical protein
MIKCTPFPLFSVCNVCACSNGKHDIAAETWSSRQVFDVAVRDLFVD